MGTIDKDRILFPPAGTSLCQLFSGSGSRGTTPLYTRFPWRFRKHTRAAPAAITEETAHGNANTDAPHQGFQTAFVGRAYSARLLAEAYVLQLGSDHDIELSRASQESGQGDKSSAKGDSLLAA